MQNEPIVGLQNELTRELQNEPNLGMWNEPIIAPTERTHFFEDAGPSRQAGREIRWGGRSCLPLTGIGQAGSPDPPTEIGSRDEPICGARNEPILAAQNEPICGAQIEPISPVQNEPISPVQNEPIGGPARLCGLGADQGSRNRSP